VDSAAPSQPIAKCFLCSFTLLIVKTLSIGVDITLLAWRQIFYRKNNLIKDFDALIFHYMAVTCRTFVKRNSMYLVEVLVSVHGVQECVKCGPPLAIYALWGCPCF